jgi:photosystem II stability/assembly factor-like uncharacterized protein
MKTIREIKTSVLIVIFVLFILLGRIALAADPPKYASDNKQHRWINIFPIGTEIHSFAVDPKNTNKMYASTYRGLFISINGGKLWETLALFKSGMRAKGSIMVIDPASPSVLYWGISWGNGRENSLWKSKDGGMNWEDISAGVIKDKIYDIAVNPKNPQIIYVASEGGLYKTFNGGKTWGKLKEETYSVESGIYKLSE